MPAQSLDTMKTIIPLAQQIFFKTASFSQSMMDSGICTKEKLLSSVFLKWQLDKWSWRRNNKHFRYLSMNCWKGSKTRERRCTADNISGAVMEHSRRGGLAKHQLWWPTIQVTPWLVAVIGRACIALAGISMTTWSWPLSRSSRKEQLWKLKPLGFCCQEEAERKE